MARLFTLAFWQAIGWALARTVMAAVVPFLPALFADPAGAWLPALLQIIPMMIVAVLTMLGGLPSVDSGPWWEVALQRAVRQFGQYLLAALPASFLLSDVDWRSVLLAAASSAVATLVLAALSIIPSAPVLTEYAPEGTEGLPDPDTPTVEETLPADTADTIPPLDV